jgi:hypothetical protein
VQGRQREKPFYFPLHLGGDDGGGGKTFPAVHHPVPHHFYFTRVPYYPDSGVCQEFTHLLQPRLVIRHLQSQGSDLLLTGPENLMGDACLFQPDPLDQAAADRVLGGHPEQLVFDGAAAGVDYEDVHFIAELVIFKLVNVPNPFNKV